MVPGVPPCGFRAPRSLLPGARRTARLPAGEEATGGRELLEREQGLSRKHPVRGSRPAPAGYLGSLPGGQGGRPAAFSPRFPEASARRGRHKKAGARRAGRAGCGDLVLPSPALLSGGRPPSGSSAAGRRGLRRGGPGAPGTCGWMAMWPLRVYTRKKRTGQRLNLTPAPDRGPPATAEALPGPSRPPEAHCKHRQPGRSGRTEARAGEGAGGRASPPGPRNPEGWPPRLLP